MGTISTPPSVPLDKLPIIDVAPLLSDDLSSEAKEARKKTGDALNRACIDYGFFYLNITAYADPDEPKELTRLAREFFDLPQAEKDKISLSNEDHARGYQRLKENVTNGKADNHEGLDFFRPVENPDKTKPLWGENQWPTVPKFREKYEMWIEKMKKLGLIVMESMAEGLGMTKGEWQDLVSQVDHSFWSMRVIGYPPLPNDHDGYSCGAHKDYGCLTFLYADPTPNALQVFLNRPGVKSPEASDLPAEQGAAEGIWIMADPIPGCIVCNIGAMWEVWTNGLYRSTLHRVVHRGSNYRIPFFFEPNIDAIIKPLDVIKRKEKEGKQMREPILYGDYVRSKVANNFVTGSERY
ncbi:hypothetical protein AGABI1DRAFT_39707 [Agaricus bisporus var. burnettii JB137-S8]|uniref:Fe2OG dioxygenase domain-containing protein n=1 Tax=Agaricus bisporus var. burnettii (strain JB137-S8 / ATCC MYA-4627 / FGSC 10392) TaxID=597362 RepID=K5X826_AGABU|nr:uncharacterized protein AGABI1DRAFT_39707 [Agaricus bisporus var. burnettii JB137-S8]EKM79373.1 hypothetical protein AGABI1DRAFT_39707 [Agaricus bisporus var. burnettii JB137-S8]